MANEEKLLTLAKAEGFENVDDMVTSVAMNGVVPAICMTPDCDHVEGMEPDQARGWCPECEDNTMKSCLVLKGLL